MPKTLRLSPIDNKSLDKLSEILAQHLYVSGLESIMCLPVTIDILGYIQKGINSGNTDDIVKSIINDWQTSLDWWKMYHPNAKETINKLKDALEMAKEYK
jgi:hypothetical protein